MPETAHGQHGIKGRRSFPTLLGKRPLPPASDRNASYTEVHLVLSPLSKLTEVTVTRTPQMPACRKVAPAGIEPATLGLEKGGRPRHFCALREISGFVLRLYLCGFGTCRPVNCTGNPPTSFETVQGRNPKSTSRMDCLPMPTKVPTIFRSAPCHLTLERTHVLCLKAFRTLRDIELYALADFTIQLCPSCQSSGGTSTPQIFSGMTNPIPQTRGCSGST